MRDRAHAVTTIKNYAYDVSTVGIVAGVSLLSVQWASLSQEEPSIWSRLTSTHGKYNSKPDSKVAGTSRFR